ncbi:MAG: DUF6599 family protein [Bacteroidales bacterium]
MKSKYLITLILILLSVSSFAQDIKLPELKGYKKTTNYPVYLAENLWDYINGAADIYLAYNFVDLHVAEYKKGKNVIKIEIYKQADNTMAFGIYSTERSPSFRFLKLGSQGYITTDGAINFFKANYYVKIRTYSKNENTLKSAESLAHIVADMITGGSEMPTALSLFPATGKKSNEETFINESVLGHKFLNKAFKSNYESGNDVFSIFIMDKNTPEETHKSIEDYLTSTGTEALDSENSRYILKDGYNGTIFLAWKGNRIVIISGLSKDQSDIADRNISEILR